MLSNRDKIHQGLHSDLLAIDCQFSSAKLSKYLKDCKIGESQPSAIDKINSVCWVVFFWNNYIGDPNCKHSSNETIKTLSYYKFVIQAMAWITIFKFVLFKWLQPIFQPITQPIIKPGQFYT